MGRRDKKLRHHDANQPSSARMDSDHRFTRYFSFIVMFAAVVAWFQHATKKRAVTQGSPTNGDTMRELPTGTMRAVGGTEGTLEYQRQGQSSGELEEVLRLKDEELRATQIDGNRKQERILSL